VGVVWAYAKNEQDITKIQANNFTTGLLLAVSPVGVGMPVRGESTGYYLLSFSATAAAGRQAANNSCYTIYACDTQMTRNSRFLELRE
jgi:hypothetical protein